MKLSMKNNSKMLSLVDDRKRHSELLNRLNIMRTSKAFCDVTIFVENQEFMAHRVILASSSDYFLSKFTEDEKCDRLSLNMKKEIFNLLLDYFYTSNLLVAKETVPQIFAAAKYLKVRRVVKVCEQFLANNLTVENIIEIRESVTLHESEDLCNATNDFLEKNIDEISKDSRITKLNMDIIVEALPKKDSEDPMAELVVDWLECALTESNVTLTDFSEENTVLFLTPSNSLVQYSEINANESSTFIKDYLKGFTNTQKNKMLVKSRPRSRERMQRQSVSASKKQHQQLQQQQNSTGDKPLRIGGSGGGSSDNEVLMVSSDELVPPECRQEPPSGDMDATPRHVVSSITTTANNIDSVTVGGGSGSIGDYSAFDSDNAFDESNDFDSISSSIKSKSSANAENETCVIAVRCEDEDKEVVQRLQFVCKIAGHLVSVSLHMRSVLEVVNQGLQESGDDIAMLLNGADRVTTVAAGGLCDSTPHSGVSSSSMSAASSLMHVDALCGGMYSDMTVDPAVAVGPATVINGYSGTETGHQHVLASDEHGILLQRLKKVGAFRTMNPISHMGISRCAAGLINIQDKLMVIGGFNRGECLNSTEIFDPVTNSWVDGVSMSTCRARLVALATESSPSYESLICAIGGSDGYKELSSMERYEPLSCSWSRLSLMAQARSHHGGCVVKGNSCSDQFVVVGGLFGPDSLRCCEIYDPIVDRWTNLAPLSTARSQAAVAAIDHQVFVVGGSDQWRCLATCEVMDVREGRWRPVPEISHSRRGAALVAHNGSLLVFGGSDGQASLRSMELLDQRGGSGACQWQLMSYQLQQPRVNVCGVVLPSGHLAAVGGFTGKHFLDTMELLQLCSSSSSSGSGLGSDSGLDDADWSMSVPVEWRPQAASGGLVEEHETITSHSNAELARHAHMLVQQHGL